MINRKNIAVAGMGYVGMSLATLLAQKHNVIAVDVLQWKVDLVNNHKSPIKDSEIEAMLSGGALSLRATTDAKEAYSEADFVIIAVPTNYNEEHHRFDTRFIEDVVSEVLRYNDNAVMVIKSTIPIGYTEALRDFYAAHGEPKPRIIFSPEFLREGRALYDNLHPSRIIVGYDKTNEELRDKVYEYLLMVAGCAVDECPMLAMGTTEAEAVKLFANSYLAMRVAFFNELDTFAAFKELDTADIINGMCLDTRIGDGYNNPSFGYGGYCFPKDTKQLLANFEGVPQELISAIVRSNPVRKEAVARLVSRSVPSGVESVVGIYRLAMKSGSDNFRESAIVDVMRILDSVGHKIIIYEPSIVDSEVYMGFPVVNDLSKFKEYCTAILANRDDNELNDVAEKVFTRDVFNNN